MFNADRLSRRDEGIGAQGGSCLRDILHFDTHEGRLGAFSIGYPESIGGQLRKGAAGVIKDVDSL